MSMPTTPSQTEAVVPTAVLGRTAAAVQTSGGLVIVGEVAEQSAGWLRVRGVSNGSLDTRDWWLPIASIAAIQVSGDA